MGNPKLLMPWPDPATPGATIIDKVLSTWTTSQVSEVVVIVRAEDIELADACRSWPVHVVQPESPPRDMKASIQVGLNFLEKVYRPRPCDRVFIAPADIPSLNQHIIDRLAEEPSEESTIVIPSYGGKQSHPVLIPWPVTSDIHDLGPDQGVDRLIASHTRKSVSFESHLRPKDIDTLEDYRAMIDSDTK